MRCFFAFVIVFAVIIGGFLAYIYSGAFNVAAIENNPGWVDHILVTVRRNSISSGIDHVEVPEKVDFTDPQRIAAGAKHYEGMCAVCHLRPGQENSETRKGLNPRPPRLPRIAKYLEPAEEFWFIKNGVRMTGMPAWGPTHTDEQIWNIVAFLEALPGMSPARYRELTEVSGAHARDHAGRHHHSKPSHAPDGDRLMPVPRTTMMPVRTPEPV